MGLKWLQVEKAAATPDCFKLTDIGMHVSDQFVDEKLQLTE